MKLFLDTNVLIDFILERPAFYLPTAMIVSFAVEGKVVTPDDACLKLQNLD